MAISSAKAQTEQLFELQTKSDFYSKKILEQKARYQDLNARWRNQQEELTKWRIKRSTGCQRDGGVYAVRTRLASEQRDASKLEKRLSACKSRESKFLAQSQQLREQIDVLRAERSATQNAYYKEQKKLRDIEKKMQAIFKESTYLMAERDKVAAQAYLLDQEDAEDQQEFDNVFLSLTEIVRRERENAESYRKQVLQQYTLDEVEELKEIPAGNEKLTPTLKPVQEAYTTDVPPDDKSPFETDCTDADGDFEKNGNDMRNEEEYFSLYRHLQNINLEIEQVENEKKELEKKIEINSQEQSIESPTRKKKTLEQLVKTRQKLVEEKSEYDRMCKLSQQEFRSYARSVEHLYNVLKCNDIVIEGRSNDIIEQFSSLQNIRSRLSESQELSLGSNLNSPEESNHASNAAKAALANFTNATGDVLGNGFLLIRSDQINSPSRKASVCTSPHANTGECSEEWDRPLPKEEHEKRVQASVAVLRLTSKLARRAKSISPKRKYRTSIRITDKIIHEHSD
ncbi:unnamed protein product [Albugo candida]|uniref:ODAD1 central coiled coil region domain-containing protein n=1 Tax=Albugo candida TaxID=65357 RepID=A0A024GPB9_9STRA|nr:unnamed protein product [Albugo candida]|eukprot:CCI48639.1 unnamed protein product [Albugo candida]